RGVPPHHPAPPPPGAPPPRAYHEADIEDALTNLGVATITIPHKGKPDQARRDQEHRRPFRRLVKWRTGSEGRISCLKRQYGWDRSLLDGTAGTRTWCGLGVFAHNLVKITSLVAAKQARDTRPRRRQHPPANGPPTPAPRTDRPAARPGPPHPPAHRPAGGGARPALPPGWPPPPAAGRPRRPVYEPRGAFPHPRRKDLPPTPSAAAGWSPASGLDPLAVQGFSRHDRIFGRAVWQVRRQTPRSTGRRPPTFSGASN